VIRIPRQRYILEADRARPEDIYEVFMEPPVERIDQRYTLDQVRYSAPLRDRMPRVDLDVTFARARGSSRPSRSTGWARSPRASTAPSSETRARCSWSKATPTRSARTSTICRSRTAAPKPWRWR